MGVELADVGAVKVLPAPPAAQGLGWDEQQRYMVWHSRSSFENMRTFFIVMFVVRFMQVANVCRGNYVAIGVVFFGLGVRAVLPFWITPPNRGRGDFRSMEFTTEEVRYWQLIQLWLVVGVPVLAIFTSLVVCDHGEVFVVNFMPTCVLQAALLYFPHWVYYKFVIPLNGVSFLVHAYLHEWLSITAVSRLVFATLIGILVYVQRDQTTGALYRESLAADRARRALEEREAETQVWRQAFRGLLDSVFDASCVCDPHGRVHSSSPHLDQLLLGSGKAAGSLAGSELAAAAASAAEAARLRAFLEDVAGSRVARKLQLSLSRPAEAGETPVAFEVAISGIGLPLAAGTSVFLGVELVAGGGALEPGEASADEAEESLDLSARVAAALPALLEAVPSEADSAAGPAVVPGRGARRSAASLCSAPALLQRRAALGALEAPIASLAGSICGEGLDGDCLPPDATVWLEGRSAAIRVADVRCGDRVLCFDHLTGGMKYTEVSEAEVHDASESEWVEVALGDGSRLQLTAEHPVFPLLAGSGGFKAGAAAVKAGELEPERHGLQVLKMVPVSVQAVKPLSAGSEALPRERVSLSVAQPARHSIFVAEAGAGAAGAGGNVAVASCSVQRRAELNGLYSVKNTFITLEEEADEESDVVRPRRRLSTAPAPAPRAASVPGSSRISTAPATRSILGSAAGSSLGSWCSSTASAASEGLPPAVVVVSSGPAANRHKPKLTVIGDPAACTARLSDALLARRQGLRSVGSLGHAQGWCMPCLMESWHQTEDPDRSKPCKNGLFCYRCHECHNEADTREIRRVRRQQERRAKPRRRM